MMSAHFNPTVGSPLHIAKGHVANSGRSRPLAGKVSTVVCIIPQDAALVYFQSLGSFKVMLYLCAIFTALLFDCGRRQAKASVPSIFRRTPAVTAEA